MWLLRFTPLYERFDLFPTYNPIVISHLCFVCGTNKMDMGKMSNIFTLGISGAEKLRKTKHTNFSGTPCMSNIWEKSYLGCIKVNRWNIWQFAVRITIDMDRIFYKNIYLEPNFFNGNFYLETNMFNRNVYLKTNMFKQIFIWKLTC